MHDETRYSFDRVVRLTLGVIALVAMLALLRYLSDVLLPFAAAVVLAYLLNPLVTLFERKTGRRGVAVALSLGGLGILGVALSALVVPLMTHQVSRFGRDLQRLRRDLVASVGVALDRAEEPPEPTGLPLTSGESRSDSRGALPVPNVKGDAARSGEQPQSKTIGLGKLKQAWARYRAEADDIPRLERLRELRAALAGTYLGDFIDQAAAYVDSDDFRNAAVGAAKRVAMGGWTVVAFAVNLVLGMTGLIIVGLYLVFLLMDYPEYARTWPTFLPPPYRAPIVTFAEQFNTALRRYFRGQAVVALCMGVLFSIGFVIIGLPMAVPLGLFIGLLNMVPYLQTVGLVPALLLALLRSLESGSSVAVSILLTLAVFAVAQLIQDAVITPRVLRQATGLRPVAILLGVFIWGKLLGFLGLLLAIPLTCLGIAYYRRYVLRHAPGGVESPRSKVEGRVRRFDL